MRRCPHCGRGEHVPDPICRTPWLADEPSGTAPPDEPEGAVGDDSQGVLSQDETRALVRNCLKHAGAPVTEDKLVQLVDWAEDVRTQASLLDLVLEGKIAVGWREGEERPVFWLTSRPAA
jgi:hypothetical protein